MVLHIHTTDQKLVRVALKKGTQIISELTEENEHGSQVLLPLIERIFKENNSKYQDLEEIEVATGPGSFTGIRVGVSVANALGFSLGIHVNGKKIETDLTY